MAGARIPALVALVALVGCRAPPPARLDWPDAPIQLRDDDDRDAAIDRLWVLPPGAERERARAEIAGAIARRITDAIEDDQPLGAAALLEQLTSLWQDDPEAIGRGLAAHAALLGRLRALLAKAGALEPAVRTLAVLAEVEPARRAAHLAELDEILEFAELLSVTEHGSDGARAQPIALLQPAALALPLPWLVDRYVGLLVDRQVAVATVLATRGASLSLVRAQGDILSTSRRIAIALARAGRADEVHRALLRLQPGIGATAEGRDRELRIAAELVADQPTADSYAELASRLRTDEPAPSPAAALAVAFAGLARHPGDPQLLASAGGDARALGRIDQAIELYEGALRGSPDVDATLALRLGKLYADRIARLARTGRPRAASSAWRAVIRFTAGVARGHPHAVWQQTAAIAESALGRGLASQGLLDEGRRALTASLERAPSIDALETLTVIDAQVDRFASAQRWVRAGIELLGDDTTGDRYRRAKLERHSADALRRAGRPREAGARYLDSLRSWASLGDAKELPRAIGAERLLDSGRAAWWLGDAARAGELVLAAVETDPASPEIATGAVAFLIEIGRYRDALDAFHRTLGEPGVPELHKIYTALWILGEARRTGEPRDRLAHEFLAGRRGDLWHERLAQAATGRIAYAALRAAATTGPRRGELAFYGAVLGLDPEARAPAGRRKLLLEVVASRVVLDAEYDLARAYLAPAPAAPLLRHVDPDPR
jgi:tetratricopeptide (TPR) repeat protein